MHKHSRPPEYLFLDRDGVINLKLPQRWVTRVEDLVLIPGAAQAIARFNAAGIVVLVVTNQRGVALEYFSLQALETVHNHLRELLSASRAHLDAIYVCPHARDACTCRKPLPGLFHQAFAEYPLARPDNSLMVGDSLSDIQAGFGIGMPTVFIRNAGRDGDADVREAERLATWSASSLEACARQLLDVQADSLNDGEQP